MEIEGHVEIELRSIEPGVGGNEIPLEAVIVRGAWTADTLTMFFAELGKEVISRLRENGVQL